MPNIFIHRIALRISFYYLFIYIEYMNEIRETTELAAKLIDEFLDIDQKDTQRRRW